MFRAIREKFVVVYSHVMYLWDADCLNNLIRFGYVSAALDAIGCRTFMVPGATEVIFFQHLTCFKAGDLVPCCWQPWDSECVFLFSDDTFQFKAKARVWKLQCTEQRKESNKDIITCFYYSFVLVSVWKTASIIHRIGIIDNMCNRWRRNRSQIVHDDLKKK